MSKRIREWLHLIAVTGAAQVAVQAIGFVSGILVIRLLPVHEYALYTLANTMLGTMILLADGGIATGVMSQGGKVWQDRQKLGAVVATGMALRKRFAVFSLLVAVPILFGLLLKHGASGLMSTLIVLSLVPAFFSSLTGRLFEVPLMLHQDIKPLQRLQVEANLGRLALLGLTMFLFPFAAMAILCAGASQVWNNLGLRKAFAGYTDGSQGVDPEARRHIVGVVRRLMPGVVFYAIYGQLSVFLLSFFGNSDSVAHIGALGRIATVMTIGGIVFNTLVVPRFARYPAEQQRALLARYVAIHGLFLASLLAGWALSSAFAQQILWILGPDYGALRQELVLAIVSSLFSTISGVTNKLNSSRNFIWHPLTFYPLIVACQAVLIARLPISTVSGALLLTLGTNAVAYVLNTGYGIYRLRFARARHVQELP